MQRIYIDTTLDDLQLHRQIVDIKLYQFQKLIKQICQNPSEYLAFESVADFFQANWLGQLPTDVQWFVTGLDDGAQSFAFIIQYHQFRFYAEIQND